MKENQIPLASQRGCPPEPLYSEVGSTAGGAGHSVGRERGGNGTLLYFFPVDHSLGSPLLSLGPTFALEDRLISLPEALTPVTFLWGSFS